MVSIIILSYNTSEKTLACLASVEKHSRGLSHEIIVVDNDSSDTSVKDITNAFPKVRLIESKKNLGFAGGCNLGAKHAKGEYVLFLNSDTEFHENTVEKLLRVFTMHPKASVVGGMLQNRDGSLQRSSASFYSLLQVARMLFGGDTAEIKRFSDNAIQSVDWVSGGCMLVKRQAFEHVGGFDEGFFMYVEDMEFCYRIHGAGGEVYSDPSSIVTHIGQGSSDKTFAIVSIYKGLKYFYKKHKNTVQYSMLLGLLRSKAYLVIVLGSLTGKKQLVERYQKALRVL